MTREECVDGMQRIIDEDQNKILVRLHVGYLIHAVKYLKEQPEIVRCKNCKYCVKELNGELFCDILAVGYEPLGSKKVNEDWFCADGERR